MKICLRKNTREKCWRKNEKFGLKKCGWKKC